MKKKKENTILSRKLSVWPDIDELKRLEVHENAMHEGTVNNIIEEMNAVKFTLEESSKYGLEVEVIYFALNAMKKNNNLTVIDALQFGLEEWDI